MNVRAKNEKRMELTEFQFTKKRESQKKQLNRILRRTTNTPRVPCKKVT